MWQALINSAWLLHMHLLSVHIAAVCAVRGVFWDRKNSRWRAQVGYNNRKIFMGYFGEPAEAARAYDKKVVQLHGALGKIHSRQQTGQGLEACDCLVPKQVSLLEFL